MSFYGYVELFAIAVWMLTHTLVHLYPLLTSLLVLVTAGPLLARFASRMQCITVES